MSDSSINTGIRRSGKRDQSATQRVGKALLSSLVASHEVREQQSVFRQYLNAFAIATRIVPVLSHRPGFVDMDGMRVMNSLESMTAAVLRCRDYIVRRLSELKIDVVKDAAHLSQVNRIAADIVAELWSADQEKNDLMFFKAPGGQTLSTFGEKSVLLTAYLDLVSKKLTENNFALDDVPDLAENFNLDRALALHTVIQRVDKEIALFAGRYLLSSERNDDFRSMIVGANFLHESREPIMFSERIVSEVVLLLADERHKFMMAVFDPNKTFSQRDRHIAYRALLRSISQDVAAVISTEEPLFVARVRELLKDERAREEYRSNSGMFIPWLRDRVRLRLDRLYPRPDEYSDPAPSKAVDSKSSADQANTGDRSRSGRGQR